MDEHKFSIGDTIAFNAKMRGLSTPGPYVVVARRPPVDGEPSYRIKSPLEPHERIALESELHRILR